MFGILFAYTDIDSGSHGAFELSDKLVDDFLLDMLHHYHMGEVAAEAFVIAIGKITPKGESDPSPEEKLLRAIFGDKAGEVKDASLKATPSLSGTVIKTALYSKALKESNRKGARNEQKLREQAEEERRDAEIAKLFNQFIEKLATLTEGKKSAGISELVGTEIIAKGKAITVDQLRNIDYASINSSKWTTDKAANAMIKDLINNYCIARKEIEARYRRIIDKIKIGDELGNGDILSPDKRPRKKDGGTGHG